METLEYETEKSTNPPPALAAGIVILLLVIFSVAGWVALGTFLLGVRSFFAGFLFLWYWTSIENAAFNRILPTVIGALAGVALAWQLQYLSGAFGVTGLVVALVVICAAIFIQIMAWAPSVVNTSTMLYITVLGAPVMLSSCNFAEVSKATVFGTIFFAAIVYAAKDLAARYGSRTSHANSYKG